MNKVFIVTRQADNSKLTSSEIFGVYDSLDKAQHQLERVLENHLNSNIRHAYSVKENTETYKVLIDSFDNSEIQLNILEKEINEANENEKQCIYTSEQLKLITEFNRLRDRMYKNDLDIVLLQDDYGIFFLPTNTISHKGKKGTIEIEKDYDVEDEDIFDINNLTFGCMNMDVLLYDDRLVLSDETDDSKN